MPEALTFRSLHDGPVVRVREYRCHARRGGPAAEEFSDAPSIVLMRYGAFCKHLGRRRVTADVNHAVFFSPGSSYRVSHPADCGDRGTSFAPCAEVLAEIVHELDPSLEFGPDRPLPFVLGPCDDALFRRHREWILSCARSSPDPLELDVTALQLVVDAVQSAFARHGSIRTRRRTTGEDHGDRVDAAKAHLAGRLGQPVRLDEVARAAHVSPYHFARMFREHTGVPVHRYLVRLRLRAALERLACGERDLTALALELGFSSHSHFTSLFLREFGCTPRAARQSRKNLTV